MTDIKQRIGTHRLVCVTTALVLKNTSNSYLWQALNFIQWEALGRSEKRSRVLLPSEGFLSENFQRNPERCIFFGGTSYGFCGHASAMNWAGLVEICYRVTRCSSCFVWKRMTPCPAMSCFWADFSQCVNALNEFFWDTGPVWLAFTLHRKELG